jgi:hypothetical protein
MKEMFNLTWGKKELTYDKVVSKHAAMYRLSFGEAKESE